MTINEYNNLDPNALYKFKMYYGDEYNGMIVEEFKINFKDYYIIKSKDINRYNSNPLLVNEIGVKVNLECIHLYEIIDRNQQQNYILANTITPVNATKLIIFGAGASYDYSYDNSKAKFDRPPLTFDLYHDIYDNILNNFPGAKSLAGPILQAVNIESFFQIQWENIKKHYNPELLSKIINTQFYLQNLFAILSLKFSTNKRSNYNSLVLKVQNYCKDNNEKVLFTSFNYDTLLEQSLTLMCGYEYNFIDDYIKPKREIILYKPHGSCNWFRRSAGSSGGSNSKYSYPDFLYKYKDNYSKIFSMLSSEISIINMNKEEDINKGLKEFPQLLIPYTDKDEFVMPRNHRDSLKYNLCNVNEILVLGWKGMEAEYIKLLEEALKGKKIKITVVNKKDETIKAIFDNKIENIDWDFQDTFSSFIEKKYKMNEPIFI